MTPHTVPAGLWQPPPFTGLADGAAIAMAAIARGLRPDPELYIDEWADRYRWLDSKSAAAPGLYRTSKTPYMRAVMRAMSPASKAQIVVFRAPRQMGKSEGGSNNVIGYYIHQAPCPIVLAMPGDKVLKRNKKSRIDPMLENIPELAHLVSQRSRREGSNSIFELNFPGGILVCLTYNSSSLLRSTPFRVGIFDEIEGAPLDVEGEGSPLDILQRGANTFGALRKLYFTSTPKWKQGSIIDGLYEETPQSRFEVPCPDCGERQELVFEQLRWEKGKPDGAEFACRGCGVLIPEFHKTKMLEAGEWRRTAEDQWEGLREGFSIEGLAAPAGWMSWKEIARQADACGNAPDKLQAFWNTTIGRSYEAAGEIADWKRLFNRRESYAIGTVPRGGMIVLCACDVQGDRIEGEVKAFGRGMESWSVEHFALAGRTNERAVWDVLAAKLGQKYPSAYGVELGITLMAVDSRYNTSHVYDFVRRSGGRAIAVRGVDDALVPVGQPKAIDISRDGKRRRRGLQVWPVSNAVFKSQIYSWLALEPPDPKSDDPYPAGYMHYPQYAPEFFEQLCAERLKTGKDGRSKWEKWRDRNEALDFMVYLLGCASRLGLDKFTDRHWDAVEERLLPEPDTAEAAMAKQRAAGTRGVRSTYFE